MKHRIISILYLSALVCLQTFAQPSLQWHKRFNGSIGNDQGNAIAVDAIGNVYVAASSDGSNFMSDYLIIKYNSIGDTVWSRRYNGNANGLDAAVAIKVDASGNVYVTGYSQSNATGYDIVTVKYNAQGVQQWVKIFDGGNNGANKDDMGYNLEVDIAGNVYVVGSSFPVGGNQTDGVVIKYSPLGTLLWKINTAEIAGAEIANLVAINNLDNIVVTIGGDLLDSYRILELNAGNGSVIKKFNVFTSPPNILPIIGFPNDIVMDGNNNMYVVSSTNQLGLGLFEVHTAKFSHTGSGTRAWDSYNQVGGSSLISGVGIEIDPALNIYVLSDFYNGNSHYCHLKKYNTSGATQWSKIFSAATGVDNIPVSLSLSNEVVNPSIFVVGNTAIGDINIVKFNDSGDTLWQKIYDCGNNGPDVASTMITDNCNNIYIAGNSNCNGTNKDVKTLKYSTNAPTITASDITTFCQGDSVILESSPANAYLWSTGATTQKIIVKTDGNYSVTAVYDNGCTAASPTVTVTVNPPPPSPIISIVGNDPTTFCQGGSVALSSNEASSYLWSNGATIQSITVSASGQYSVTVSNAVGCTAASLTAVSVTVLPLPTATITSVGPTTFCQGGSVTLTTNSASLYNWSNGATTPSITVSTGDQYSVTITDINGCTNASLPTTVTVIPSPTATITPPGPVDLCEGDPVTLTASTASAYNWSTGATTQSITVSTTGMYSVTVTGANMCTATSPTTLVAVHPLPEATITASGTTAFCEGGSVTLTSSDASSYQWSNGATTQSVTVSTGGNYLVTITDANGCTDASPFTLVTVHPLPMLDLGDDITLTQGDSAILNAGQWSEYKWSTGATTPTITVNSTGTYFVTVTDSFDCTATDSVVVTVTSSTSGLDGRYKITVFPNPAQWAINIQCIGGATNSVQVFDKLSRLVLEDSSFAPDGAVRTLFLDKAPNGTYYVRIAGEGFAKAISILKQ